jgi:hypothetical protein
MLYGAPWLPARALGYRRLLTYTLSTERGTSLTAAGFRPLGRTRGGTWDRPSRPRRNNAPLEPKTLWERYDTLAGEGHHRRSRVQVRRQKAHRRLVASRPVTFTCLLCNEAVTQERFPGPRPRYCSAPCRDQARRDRQRALMRRRRENVPPARSASPGLYPGDNTRRLAPPLPSPGPVNQSGAVRAARFASTGRCRRGTTRECSPACALLRSVLAEA